MQKVALIIGGALLVIVGLLSCRGSNKVTFGPGARPNTSVRTQG